MIGPSAECLSYLICTAERTELLQDLAILFYGPGTGDATNTVANRIRSRSYFQTYYFGNGEKGSHGRKKEATRPAEVLGKEGFPVRNHVTGEVVRFPPKVFAAFMMVLIADFLEQGVSSPLLYPDEDIGIFQFVRLIFFADCIRFISPYLDVIPSVWEECGLLKDSRFAEPTREELVALKRIWDDHVAVGALRLHEISSQDEELLRRMTEKYPFIPEPMAALAATCKSKGKEGKGERERLKREAMRLVEQWGMLFYKQVGHIKDFHEAVELI